MIRAEHLTKRYADKLVLDDLSFEIPAGITAITGKNGSGKTTLLRILAGLEKYDSGTLILPAGARISYAFQDCRLVPSLTVLENIALVLKKDSTNKKCQPAIAWLEAVGLRAEADAYPDTLSGGMKQRINLARAFAYDGDILLLDEAFTALDDTWKTEMMDLVLDRFRDRTVVLVTHDPAEIEYLQCRKLELS